MTRVAWTHTGGQQQRPAVRWQQFDTLRTGTCAQSHVRVTGQLTRARLTPLAVSTHLRLSGVCALVSGLRSSLHSGVHLLSRRWFILNKPLLPIFNIYSINHFCKKHAHITAHRSRSRGAGRPGAAARSYYSILTVGARRTERHSRRAPSRHAWSAVCASNDAWQTPRGNLREADVQTSTIMRPHSRMPTPSPRARHVAPRPLTNSGRP